MINITYKEPLLSKLIFYCRLLYLKSLRISARIKKKWHSLNQYFTAEYWQNNKKNYYFRESKNLDHSQLHSEHFDIKDCADSKPNLSARLAVYTCIYGPYDVICEPLYKSKQCDYFIITDQEISPKSTWKKIEPNVPENFAQYSFATKNRYFKMHPHLIFSEYQYSLYVDGNIKLLTDLYPFIQYLDNKIVGLFNHPFLDCVYSAAELLKSIGIVDPQQSNQQLSQYKTEGFPEHFGYFECGFLLRNHYHPLCQRVMSTWWEQYQQWVKRDQQSFVYALWVNGMCSHDVAFLGNNIRNNPRFFLGEHQAEHKLILN